MVAADPCGRSLTAATLSG